MLSRTLSKQGYDVALFDFRGYGESDRPEGVTFENYDFRNDVDTILSHLQWDQCALIGYSLGASIAMNYCASYQDPRVKAIVSLKPGRRFYERILADNAKEYNAYKSRYIQFTGLKRKLPEHLFRSIFANANIDNAIDYFKTKHHSPLLLVDGEKEGDAFKQYMRKYFESIGEPKSYCTIPGAHHFFNMSSLFSKFIKDKRQQVDIIYYNKKIYHDYVHTILNWLEMHAESDPNSNN
jgi:pimeloyl-ACP methyl ester carboxylesterase